jgi:hypothetical protein
MLKITTILVIIEYHRLESEWLNNLLHLIVSLYFHRCWQLSRLNYFGGWTGINLAGNGIL